MARSLYAVLGVPTDADQRAIKKAYRRIALETHPDRHPGDASKLARFKEAGAAYEILSDPDKRTRYDQTGSTHTRPASTSRTPSWEDRVRRMGGRPGSVTWEGLEKTLRSAFEDKGFRRIFFYAYQPSPSWFWKEQGFFGSREFQRTVKTADDLYKMVSGRIIETLRRAGIEDDGNLDRYIVLVVDADGHIGVAWTTPQDAVSREFGFRTRWYSLQVQAPKKSPKRGEGWTRPKVESFLMSAGLRDYGRGKKGRWSTSSSNPHYITVERGYVGNMQNRKVTRQILQSAVDKVKGWAPPDDEGTWTKDRAIRYLAALASLQEGGSSTQATRFTSALSENGRWLSASSRGLARQVGRDYRRETVGVLLPWSKVSEDVLIRWARWAAKGWQ